MGKPHPQASVRPLVGTPVEVRSPWRRRWLRPSLEKNWDRHVAHTEELSHTPGFEQLREVILEPAQLTPLAHELSDGLGTLLEALEKVEQVPVDRP